MLDIKDIRENPKAYENAFAKRSLKVDINKIIEIDKNLRKTQTALQDMQEERNETSKKIGILKSQGQDCIDLFQQVNKLKDSMATLQSQEEDQKTQIQDILTSLPNLPHDDVPFGTTESDNHIVNMVGNLPQFPFAPLDHVTLGTNLNLMDFETAAKMSGARFVLLKGQLAKLERALGQFMLDVQTQEFGYVEVSPPLLVKQHAAFGTGQLPKFAEDLFLTTSDHYLVPTAEIPLTNIVAGQILNEENLPLRYTALTPSFRSEAGSAGKDTHGMIRQHQFYKVELVSIVDPKTSYNELERMVKCAEAILQKLNLPYRKTLLCSGDIGFSASKTYDLEVWLPGQNQYREISSCSLCTDFQARRMQTKFRSKMQRKPQFVHTLNGSGLAVGRALIAVIENYQQEDQTIAVPDVLKPYMNNIEIIK